MATITVLKTCLEVLPVNQAIMLFGRTGIGKSSFWRQHAAEHELEYIDCRLGQMTEGDLLGLYSIEAGATINHPQKWFIDACNKPCLLHFDELNRALPTVLQGVFQVILDRNLNGMKLHPDTRVVASVNMGNEYDVVDMDPALLDRFAVFDFEPTIEEMLSHFVDQGVHKHIIDFLSKNQGHVEPSMVMVSGKVYPSRRSWQALASAIDKPLKEKNRAVIYPVARSLVGDEASTAFVAFLDDKKSLHYLDVLKDFEPAMLKDLELDEITNTADTLVQHMVRNYSDMTDANKKNFAKFFAAVPDEVTTSMWRAIAQNGTVAESLGNGYLLERIAEVF